MAKTKRQFSPEETETIINRYKTTNVLLKDIAKDYHCANKTIRELLIKNRVTIHKRGRIIPEKDIQETIKMYNEGKSLAEIAKILGRSKNNLSKHLKLRGIKIINRQNLTRFNEHVFDVIDTEEKAY